MGPGSRFALLIAAGAHLGLVGANGLGVQLPGRGWARQAIVEYGALSGADSVWSFFTSDAGTHRRATFEGTSASGDTIFDVLERPVNPEVDIRVADLFSLLWSDDGDLQHDLLTSWAGVMFARYPGIDHVVARVEVSEMPTMKEYRAGQRHRWRVIHRASFSRPTSLRPSTAEVGR